MRYSLLLLYARMHMLMPQELNCISISALHEQLWCLSNEVRMSHVQNARSNSWEAMPCARIVSLPVGAPARQ